jgi:hypothetical protein
MKMNRRNALIGLGAIATGGGAVFGSGAFSTVDADRSVSVTLANDTNANLQLEVDPNNSHSGISDGSPNGTNSQTIISLNVTGVNDDASTTFNGALRITNNGASNPTVTVSIDESGVGGISFTINTTSLAAGESTLVDMTVDSTTNVSDGTITISATS